MMFASRAVLIPLFALVVSTFSRPAAAGCQHDLEVLGMEYVTLDNGRGETRRVSRLVLGTDHLEQADWTHPGQPEATETQAFAVLDEATRLGINLFDTAPIYVGGVEHRLGDWRRARVAGHADRRIHVLTKGGFPFDLYWAKHLEKGTHSPQLLAELKRRGILNDDGTAALQNVPAGTYGSRLYGDGKQITERVAEELGHSRANLDGDITIYLMHRDDGDAVLFEAVARDQVPVETIMRSLGDDAVGGKVWALGWSNWHDGRVNESLRVARESAAVPKPVINSPYFSLFEMSPRTIHALGVQVTHAQMMDPEFQKGIKIMPYSPLGGFSILDKPAPVWENAKQSAREKYEAGDPYWRNVYPAIFTPENEARWNRVNVFTEAFNAKHSTSYTVDQMVNAYALAHPRTDLLAVGAITPEQVRRTVEALKLSKLLTPRDLEYLYSGH